MDIKNKLDDMGFTLKFYRENPEKLHDLIPWDMILTASKTHNIPQGIVYNRDGTFQKTFEFRGPDMDAATKEEIDMMIFRLNNIYKRLGAGWCIYAEAQRAKATFYPECSFPDPVTAVIDKERKFHFQSGNHYESKMYMTLCWLPPKEKIKKLESIFTTKPKDNIYFNKENVAGKTLYDVAQEFLKNFNDFFSLFKEVMNYARELNDNETVTYLHSTISTHKHKLVRPACAVKLNQYITDDSYIGGFKPVLGNKHIRVITIQGYPQWSAPGMFDALNNLTFEYRWVTRFIPLDTDEAKAKAKEVEKEMYRGRMDATTFITSQFSPDSTIRYDNNALNQAEEASAAHDAVASGYASFGHMTTCVVLMDENVEEVEKQAQVVRKLINERGFTCRNETTNASMAWLGTIPCNPYANVVKPILSSENLADLFPFSSIWSGNEKNKHYDLPSLLYTQTSGSTPWRLNLHANGGDVGHTLIIGPTGSGKSVLLGTIIAQFRKYPDSKIIVFDKDASTRVLTYATGGEFYDLSVDGNAMAFQPFANIHEPEERVWAAEWVKRYFESQNITIDAKVNKDVDDALAVLATDKPKNRNITGLCLMLANEELRAALAPLDAGGLYGNLFNARNESVSENSFQVFEMGKLMEKAIIVQALEYLFHYVNRVFKVRENENKLLKSEVKEKTKLKLLILDECWAFLKNPAFAAQMEDWLKTLRKFNVSVVFATQEVADIVKSPIKDAILNNCLTKIYLPNANAIQEGTFENYQSFGLNKREINKIAEAVPKREYYYKCNKDSRKFELAMGKFALAFIAASDVELQEAAIKIYKEGLNRTDGEKVDFAANWLAYRRMSDEFKFYEEIRTKFEGDMIYAKKHA